MTGGVGSNAYCRRGALLRQSIIATACIRGLPACPSGFTE